jgi:uncharacterized protein (DUF697 family)/uncharacterized membrane protein YebE (DUF533 family)
MSSPPANEISEVESLACLRVLVAMAQTDGVLHESERVALEAAFAELPLPAGTTLEQLWAERRDFAALLSQVKTPAVRERLYQSACAVARADGGVDAEEEQLLAAMQLAFEIAPQQLSLIERLFSEAKDTLLLSNIAAIADPDLRAAAIAEDITKYSVISAVLGAFPVPGLAIAADLAVVAVQVKLLRDIGQYYGFELDQSSARELLTGLGLGTGVRIAVSNIAKLVPLWGSAFGAATAFGSTWALGRIAVRYFDSGMSSDLGQLRAELRAAQGEAKQVYEQQRDAIAAKAEQHRVLLEQLGADLESGRITPQDYEQRITQLG